MPKQKRDVQKPRRKRKSRKSLADVYRGTFTAPRSATFLLTRERLTMYKSVPSVTTYGAYEKPI